MLDELSTLSRYVCAPLHDRSTEGSQHRPQPPCSALGGRPLSVSLRGLRKHPSTLPAAHLPHETPQDPASHRMAGASKRDGHVACSAHRTCQPGRIRGKRTMHTTHAQWVCHCLCQCHSTILPPPLKSKSVHYIHHFADSGRIALSLRYALYHINSLRLTARVRDIPIFTTLRRCHRWRDCLISYYLHYFCAPV